MGEVTTRERESLADAAVAAAVNAHAPYSRFRVGSAVLGEKGTYTGVNVENASYGLTLCAERSALAAAVAAGERNIRALAVACVDAPPGGPREALFPCGACRQWLMELAPEAVVIVHGAGHFTVPELLPHAFQLERAGR